MKTKMILALLVFATSIVSYSQISKAEIVATGLTCSMCSNAINKQLKALPEVETVVTDLDRNTFTVTLKKDTDISPLRLKQSVEKAGFFVGSMVITLQLEQSALAADGTIAKENNVYIFVDDSGKQNGEEIRARVIDKGFVTQKEYKKLIKSMTKYPSYIADTEKTYHLKMI